MPKISISLPEAALAQRNIVRFGSAGAVPPPGSVPSSGGSASSGQSGRVAFESRFLLIVNEPIISEGAFPARLSETISELVAGATASAADIAISKAVADNTSADMQAVRGRNAVVASEAQAGRPSGWWITVVGAFQASQNWQLANLNRAIARAFGNTTTWRTLVPSERVDANWAGLLNTALNQPNACTGRRDYATENGIVAACTRWAPLRASAGADSQPGKMTEIPAPTNEPGSPAGICVVRIADYAYVRPTQTFDRVGPRVPTGTKLQILDVTERTQGTLRLYKVRVAPATEQTVEAAKEFAGNAGFAALSQRDVATCLAAIEARDAQKPREESTRTGTGTGGSTGGLATREPDRQNIVPRPVPQPAAPPVEESSNTALYVAGGAVVLLAGGAAVWYAMKKKKSA